MSARRRKDKKSTFIAFLALAFCFIFLLFESGALSDEPQTEDNVDNTETVGDDLAEVHFINVGQGDCELIISENGSTILIDAGEAEYGASVLAYLKDQGITHLDYLIATHPHSDHMGGLSTIITSDITIGSIIMPKIAEEYTPTTKTYERFLDSVSAKGYKLNAAKTEAFDFDGGKVNIYMTDYDGDNMNNYSVVLRYDYGDSSFLFTGDIESKIEKELIELGADLDIDVLKVAHHGSSTSSCKKFLEASTPEYCVIECGDNSYNHPHSDTVDKLRGYTDIILRTDINGHIVFMTDGKTNMYSMQYN